MLGQRVELTLDAELFGSLQERVQRGESASIEDLIGADLRTVHVARSIEDDDLAAACAAYQEMKSGTDPGIPIEDIMARFGVVNARSPRKTA